MASTDTYFKNFGYKKPKRNRTVAGGGVGKRVFFICIICVFVFGDVAVERGARCWSIVQTSEGFLSRSAADNLD
jgi:hypothetical protein